MHLQLFRVLHWELRRLQGLHIRSDVSAMWGSSVKSREWEQVMPGLRALEAGHIRHFLAECEPVQDGLHDA